MKQLIVIALAILAASTSAVPQVRIPSLPGGVKVPGLDSFAKEEPPVTTSFKGARPEAPPLDRWTPHGAQPLASAPRFPDGSFRLARGAVTACMQARTRLPVATAF